MGLDEKDKLAAVAVLPVKGLAVVGAGPRGGKEKLTYTWGNEKTPDGKWLVFSGNFHSPRIGGRAVTHTYAVEIARTTPPKSVSSP